MSIYVVNAEGSQTPGYAPKSSRFLKALPLVLGALAAAQLLLVSSAYGQTKSAPDKGSYEKVTFEATAVGESLAATTSALAPAPATTQSAHKADPAPNNGQQRPEMAMTVAALLPSVEEMPALGRTVTLKLQDVTLARALDRVAAEARVRVAYLRETADTDRRVTLKAEGRTARAAFRSVLEGTDLTLTRASGTQLVLVPRRARQEAAAHRPEAASLQKIQAALPATVRAPERMQGTITGTVTDADTGEPLPGVSVAVEGTQLGAATGADGTYQIPGVEPGTYTVRASFVGYGDETEQAVEVSEGATTTVDFTMTQAVESLDEVVVVGYGEQQRRDLTGAVSSISSEEIEQASPSSPESILQGRMAGVQVTTNSGEPGAAPSVRIRGSGSITSGSEPLYVIDGVPVQGSSGGGNSTGPNPLATINPQNIESMEVLKDASATAIYGARGANGVVLITTTRGQARETRVNFTGELSSNNVSKTYDLLSAEQYATLANEVRQNQGAEPYFENPSSLGEGTDWQGESFSPGLTQNYQVSISGGDDNTRFAVSGNYLNDEGINKGSGFKRYSFRANLNRDISDRFRIGNSLTVSRGIYNQGRFEGPFQAGASAGAKLSLPTLTPYQDREQGVYTHQWLDSRVDEAFPIESPVTWHNELTDQTTLDRVLGEVYAEFDLTENLYVRSSIGGDIENEENEYYEGKRLIFNQNNGYATLSSSNQTSVLNENVLKYNRTFGEVHDLDVTAGFTWQNEVSENQSMQSANFLNDITKFNAIGAGNPPGGPGIGSGRSEWTLLSYLGRVNYTFDDKYLLTLTGRYDGSSKFGADNKWGFFPSGALGWLVSEEAFMQEQDLVSNLKLRTSYGRTGNQSIGTYNSLARLSTTPDSFGGREVTGFYPGSVANPDLRWESTLQFDVGIDLGLWNQRLRFTADYYRKRTEDLLLGVTLPTESGFDSSVQNAGNIENIGFELSLGADLLTGAFTWSSNANFAANDNEVTDLGPSGRFSGGYSGSNIVTEGEPLGAFFGYRADGIFADQAEIDAHGAQPDAQPGDIRFVDTDSDGDIDADDRTVIGNPYPNFTYGWTNNFTYGGFDLSVFVQGTSGNDVYHVDLPEGLSVGRNKGSNNDLGSNSIVRRFEGRWTPQNTDATYPRAGYEYPGYGEFNDRHVEDASYLRLKNVTLGYDLPLGSIGVPGVRSARLFVQARNLLTLTDYTGYDPDVNTFGQGSVGRGIDSNGYPLARTYTVGINLGF
jgi:TonB-linked SusC/RagA family outer membrane protein